MAGTYHLETYYSNGFTGMIHPISSSFVKRPYAHQFRELYFFNPKAQQFKLWTGAFLGSRCILVLETFAYRQLILIQRRNSLGNFNSNSTDGLDVNNFIGQVHLSVYYIVVFHNKSNLHCYTVLFKCALRNAQQLSLFNLTKLEPFCLRLL
jgi:hypothetical protein